MRRNNSIELLRIVLMTCIVLCHMRWLYLPEEAVGIGLKSLAVAVNFHVDVFVLISGYFGIRQRWHALCKNYVLCLFYAVVLGLVRWSATGNSHWTWMLMPWSRDLWWFMSTYFLLILVAPWIEQLLGRMKARKQGMVALSLLMANMLLGFLKVVPLHYSGGLPLLNFVTLYCLGICLRENRLATGLKRSTLLLGILLTAGCNLALAHLQGSSLIPYDVLSYASPVTILQALCVLMLFLAWRVPERKALTYYSSSIMAVYLITEYPVCREWLRTVCTTRCPDHPVLALAFILLLTALVLTSCVTLDKIRKLIHLS